MSSMSKWLVVGLSGVTNGGKTTLATKLLDVLPTGTRIIKQDNYFYPEDDPHHVPCPGGLKHHNWDILSSINMEKMIQDVQEIIDSQPLTSSGVNAIGENSVGPRPVLLLDGFLFGDPKLTKLCDLRYFLTLSRDECWERRKLRTYEPPDPPGYFDVCVWPMYEQHLEYVQKNVCDVMILDGSVDHFPDVLHRVLSLAGLKPTDDQHNGSSEGCAYV